MPFISKEKQKAFAEVMAGVKACENCQRKSSQTRLFDIDIGLLCGTCLPDNMNGGQAHMQEMARKERLKAQENMKPENYGDWA